MKGREGIGTSEDEEDRREDGRIDRIMHEVAGKSQYMWEDRQSPDQDNHAGQGTGTDPDMQSPDKSIRADIVFDGADQIDSQKYVIKGGGGALLRENILFSLANKVVVMADKTKFVKNFTRTVPIEIHPLARNAIINSIKKLGGESKIRSLDRGYPFFTENGNIILDCDFGTIKNPKILTQKIKQIPGVLESGIFMRKPDIIYKAKTNGKFEII